MDVTIILNNIVNFNKDILLLPDLIVFWEFSNIKIDNEIISKVIK